MHGAKAFSGAGPDGQQGINTGVACYPAPPSASCPSCQPTERAADPQEQAAVSALLAEVLLHRLPSCWLRQLPTTPAQGAPGRALGLLQSWRARRALLRQWH